MLSTTVAALRKFCQALLASNAPEQLALGFTIGMVIGLVVDNSAGTSPVGVLVGIALGVVLGAVAFWLRVRSALRD